MQCAMSVSNLTLLENVSCATSLLMSSVSHLGATPLSHLESSVSSPLETLIGGIEDVLTYCPQNPFTSLLAFAWLWMTANFSRTTITTGVPIVLHEAAYFFGALPSFIFQFIPSMQRFKIQPNHPETAKNQWTAFRVVFFHHVCTQAPMMLLPPTLGNFFSIPCDWDSMPRWYVLAVQVYFCAMCEDTWHYFCHLLFHTKHFYKRFHKPHHTFRAPFGLTAEYSHPLEITVLGLGFFIGLIFVCNHIATMFAWVILRILTNVDAHCGYDIPYNPLHLIPFYAGARYHDFHHSHNNANFSAIFIWWDWLLGTDKPYRRHLAKLKAAPKQMEEH